MALSRLVKFLKLPCRKKRIFLTAFGVIWVIRIVLWVLPYSCIRKLASGVKAKPEVGELTVEELVWSVETAGKYVLNATCLSQALAAKMLLAWNGYSSTLRIGVDTCNGFAAHAWIEQNGVVILGGSVRQYKPLYVLE
jgi:hypothetical protein